MNFEQYFKLLEYKFQKTNIDSLHYEIMKHLVQKTPLPTYLEVKLSKIEKKYGWKRSKLLNEALESNIAALHLAKSTTRQSLAEKAQIKFLKSKGLSVEKLSSSGPEALRLYEGRLIYGSTVGLLGQSKSIDALCGNIFISLKHINEAGGSQDNQVEDCRKFLVEARKYTSQFRNNKKFFVVISGYYGVSKIKYLSMYTNNRVNICSIDNFY